MFRGHRRALIAAAGAALAALSVTACGGDADTTSGSVAPVVTGTVRPTPQPSTPQSSSPEPSSAAPSPTQPPTETEDAVDITVAVAEGTVTPALDQVPIALGDQVRLAVTSDVADEVHVHGLDLTLPLEVGVEGVLEFTVPADFVPGVYEVELEGSGLLLFMLEMR